METTRRQKENPEKKSPVIYGVHPVLEAMNTGQELEKIFIRAGISGSPIGSLLQQARALGIPVQQVPPEKLDALVRGNHQGVVAYISAIRYQPFEEVISGILASSPDPFFVVLDGITDVRNFGAIARSAVCFGASAIILQGKGSAQGNSDAVKTSAGALNHIPVCRVDSLPKAITFLKENEIRVIGLTEKAKTELKDLPLSGPLAIVLGSENEGLSVPVLRWADELVRIPLKGDISSLNVSAAAAISFYEVIRQRSQA
jgi:23S rRNA (guanosine2251-2'-O)-methyltransferase